MSILEVLNGIERPLDDLGRNYNKERAVPGVAYRAWSKITVVVKKLYSIPRFWSFLPYRVKLFSSPFSVRSCSSYIHFVLKTCHLWSLVIQSEHFGPQKKKNAKTSQSSISWDVLLTKTKNMHCTALGTTSPIVIRSEHYGPRKTQKNESNFVENKSCFYLPWEQQRLYWYDWVLGPKKAQKMSRSIFIGRSQFKHQQICSSVPGNDHIYCHTSSPFFKTVTSVALLILTESFDLVLLFRQITKMSCL